MRRVEKANWSSLRSHARDSSEYVPDAFRQLIDAQSEVEADTAYWQLDNRVVTQGRLYEAAEQLVPFLLSASSST